MRIQSLQTYKVLQQIKHFNAYTIILIYNINPDGGELTRGEYGSFIEKQGVNRARANCRGGELTLSQNKDFSHVNHNR